MKKVISALAITASVVSSNASAQSLADTLKQDLVFGANTALLNDGQYSGFGLEANAQTNITALVADVLPMGELAVKARFGLPVGSNTTGVPGVTTTHSAIIYTDVSALWSYPVAEGVNAYASLGLGYSSSKTVIETTDSTGETWVQEVPLSGVGTSGGIGASYQLSPQLNVVADYSAIAAISSLSLGAQYKF